MKVLVISARGLQTAAVAGYGNLWIDTPTLDRLAAEGVVFDRHYLTDATPAGSRQVWRTGSYGTAPANLVTRLREQGVYPALVIDGSRPADEGFTEGWGRVVRAMPASDEETPLEATLNALDAVLREVADRDRWLVWLDVATLLPPWNVPEVFQKPYFDPEQELEEDEGEDKEDEHEDEEDEAAEGDGEEVSPPPVPVTAEEVGPGVIDAEDDVFFFRVQSSYAAAVSYLDAGLGQLLEAIAEGLDEVAVVLTTDRGQALGEHGHLGDARPWLHEEVVHLPLIIRLPGAAHAGRRVDALTQPVDLAPTLAELCGVPFGVGEGRSLLPLCRGERGEWRGEAYSWNEQEAALRTAEWALLVSRAESGGKPRLFVKPDDRHEVNDVSQHHLELAEEMEQKLRAWLKTNG